VGETAELMLSRVLRERGQRVTPQRLAIARTVRELDRHTTAETVFGHVSEQMPGVSLPTVYATLELLEELGLVRRLASPTGSAVYDARRDAHHHLVCRGCGRITDVDGVVDDDAVLRAARRAGFAPDDAQLVIRGLCADCRASGAASAAA
jgi:Fe2+ or Zn2+ uptake regulation protein